MFQLVGTGSTDGIAPHSLNILGDFNIAGETWMIRDYYERMGVQVVATITGDGRVDDIRRRHGAALNVVQCSGSMIHLAKMMEEQYGIPFLRVSYFGIEDMSKALYDVADFFKDEAMLRPDPATGPRRSGRDHARPATLPPRPGRQAGRRLHGRGVQGLFAGPLAAHAGHEDRAGRFADRQPGGLPTAQGTVRRRHDPGRRHQPAGVGQVRAGDSRSICSSAASRNGPSPTSWASASATTTTSARSAWPASRAC